MGIAPLPTETPSYMESVESSGFLDVPKGRTIAQALTSTDVDSVSAPLSQASHDFSHACRAAAPATCRQGARHQNSSVPGACGRRPSSALACFATSESSAGFDPSADFNKRILPWGHHAQPPSRPGLRADPTWKTSAGIAALMSMLPRDRPAVLVPSRVHSIGMRTGLKFRRVACPFHEPRGRRHRGLDLPSSILQY